MTNRERFCRLFDFKKVDRPPRWEAVAFWQETVQEWVQAGTFPKGADPMAHYEFDLRPTVTGGLGLTSMALSGPPVRSRVVEDDGRRRVVEDDLGAVQRIRTDGPSMPQFIRFPVESRADWERKIKPRLDPAAHDRAILDREVQALPPGEHPVGFWAVGLYAYWRNFWGEEKLAFAFYDAPDVLHEMAAVWLRMHCECSPPIFERVRVDWTLFHEDMACKGGPLIGPKMFREFMMPYYRDLFAHLRRLGQQRFLVDSDGNNGAVLDCFIELGVRGLYPFEVAAGNDTLQVRSKYPEMMIWGGIDKRVLLKSKQAVEREVMDKVPVLWEMGGFIPSIDHAVPPCPQENFEYFLELVRGMF